MDVLQLSPLNWLFHTSSTTSNNNDDNMSRFVWLVLATLIFLVAALGESWIPGRITKLRQNIRERKRRHRQRHQQATKNHSNTDGTKKSAQEQQQEEEAERKRLSLLPWWEDSWSEAFMNSFPLSSSSPPVSSSAASTVASVDPEEGALAKLEPYQPNPNAQILHFCFILHGHRGFSTDLSYLQRVMQHHAELGKRERYSDDDTVVPHDMIVHCSVCNEGKTMDGVVNGGERMVREILDVIRQELDRRQSEQDKIQDITISIVGNSLGGIYGRYAIARLAQKAADQENHPCLTQSASSSNSTESAAATDDDDDDDDDNCDLFDSCVLLDGKYRLHFNIFCTTATPHLGISKHTYVPIPRSVEIGAAHVLGETGRDLFRLNDLMKTMATCPTYLEPLRKFRKRVAYANAYGTDFPVPASTAAFLSDQSTYPHHFAATNNNNNNTQTPQEEADSQYVIATLHTQQSKLLPVPSAEQEAVVDDLVQMSQSLDSLGWKKVFVDVRKEIPLQVSLQKALNIRKSLSRTSLLLTPKILLRRGSGYLSEEESDIGTPTSSSDDDEDDASPPVSAIHRLRQKGVVESRDVASVVTTPEDMKLSVPIGHNLLVALSRDGISGGLYKAGRPVMDTLAKELVSDIFDWNFQEETEVAEKTMLEGELSR
ncbi:Putative serine esterase (DUF676) [Seminavis robusta]|uniref:Serine esterase (DUF676) n=1 Tax=Seminavis robusta TaxID=568900 RepID=A0A9N8HXV3_9STRA|nr:Putative serine esterase (DUF676) [Seminavis robusta]|eukprot:Sro2588_g332010.1 Putative serine esterase (DUF676) (657) ;mRNA; r:9899-11869